MRQQNDTIFTTRGIQSTLIIRYYDWYDCDSNTSQIRGKYEAIPEGDNSCLLLNLKMVQPLTSDCI